MKFSRVFGRSLMAAASVFILQSAASAQTVSGEINATITLTSACEVNGSTGTEGVDFGLLDFGSHTTLFTQATTELEAGGATGISVQCSPGSDASLTITAGANDNEVDGSLRAMTNGTSFVPYDIYSDSGFSAVLANNDSIDVIADGSVKVVPIYGRALGNAALTEGTYTDTISVTLSF